MARNQTNIVISNLRSEDPSLFFCKPFHAYSHERTVTKTELGALKVSRLVLPALLDMNTGSLDVTPAEGLKAAGSYAH